jgi:hypothetical protein
MATAQWETIVKTSTDSTQRMKVPGGWLVCRVNGVHLPQGLVGWFVPDPNYLWDVEATPAI